MQPWTRIEPTGLAFGGPYDRLQRNRGTACRHGKSRTRVLLRSTRAARCCWQDNSEEFDDLLALRQFLQVPDIVRLCTLLGGRNCDPLIRSAADCLSGPPGWPQRHPAIAQSLTERHSKRWAAIAHAAEPNLTSAAPLGHFIAGCRALPSRRRRCADLSCVLACACRRSANTSQPRSSVAIGGRSGVGNDRAYRSERADQRERPIVTCLSFCYQPTRFAPVD